MHGKGPILLDKILNLISLAQKAGKVRAGEYLTEKAVKEGMAHLVIIASDTSQKAQERIKRMCDAFDTNNIVYADKKQLGHFTGNREKSVVCVIDEGFSKAILKQKETEKM